MPSLDNLISKNAARIAAGGPTGTGIGPESMTPEQPLVKPVAPQLDLPYGSGLPQRGTFPASNILASDLSDSNRSYRGMGMRTAAFPYPPTTPNASTVAAATVVSPSAAVVNLLLEVNGSPTQNQKVANFIAGSGIEITSDVLGGITIVSTSAGDGLIHGDPIWDVDSAAVRLYDDFTQFNLIGSSFTGNFTSALPWACTGTPTGGTFGQWTGAPPYIGQVFMGNGTASYTGAVAASTILSLFGNAGFGTQAAGWPLMDYPSWKLVWNFSIGRSYSAFNQGSQLPVAFSWTKVSFYAGLGSSLPQAAVLTGSNSPRPAEFVGLRYDTDPGVTYTLSAVANASGGNTVYTGTFAGGSTANSWYGQTFTVAGFANSNNNGTFTCVASTSTTITLNNPNGVAVTAAGTAAAASTGDTQFVFEAVSNYGFSAQRNNTQGHTVNTGITVTEGRNYRFEMTCTTVGSVTMTLTDGVTSFTSSVTIPTIFFPAPTAGITQTLPGYINNGYGLISNGGNPTMPFVAGSKLTSSGWSAALASFNGTLVLAGMDSNGQVGFISAAGATGPTSQSARITGYAPVAPWFAFGNDSQATPAAFSKAVFLDAFEFVWNPGVAGLGSATPSAILPRYF